MWAMLGICTWGAPGKGLVGRGFLSPCPSLSLLLLPVLSSSIRSFLATSFPAPQPSLCPYPGVLPGLFPAGMAANLPITDTFKFAHHLSPCSAAKKRVFLVSWKTLIAASSVKYQFWWNGLSCCFITCSLWKRPALFSSSLQQVNWRSRCPNSSVEFWVFCECV